MRIKGRTAMLTDEEIRKTDPTITDEEIQKIRKIISEENIKKMRIVISEDGKSPFHFGDKFELDFFLMDLHVLLDSYYDDGVRVDGKGRFLLEFLSGEVIEFNVRRIDEKKDEK